MGRRHYRRLSFTAIIEYLLKMNRAEQFRDRANSTEQLSAVPAIIMMGLAALVTFIVLLATLGAFDNFPYLFLLPWVFGLAVVMAVPLCVLNYQGRFSLANPLVFATLSYFFPAFVVGGFLLAGGWSQPGFLPLIQDIQTDLPFTIVLVALGFGGLAIGYLLPIGAKLGGFVASRIPSADYSPSSLIIPSVFLMLLGSVFFILSFTTGGFGYQTGTVVNSYDGLIYLTSRFSLQATVFLWLIIFQQRRLSPIYLLIIGLIGTISIGAALFAGNRAGILQILVPVMLSYILAGRKITFRQTVIVGILLPIFLVVGMIYGTTFRSVKGTEEQQNSAQYAENVAEAFNEIGRSDVSNSVSSGFSSLVERIDILSTLAVVASNYEKLKPYEEAYGIDNNIWVDSTTFFIPRVLWPDKPVASDPRRYSDLYFDFSGSSYAITPIGDLLRNFGVIGVPIGMAILGLILRFIYRIFVEGQKPVIWKLSVYFMLISTISYESFYATIIPNMIKVGFTAMIGVLLVNLIAKKMEVKTAAEL